VVLSWRMPSLGGLEGVMLGCVGCVERERGRDAGIQGTRLLGLRGRKKEDRKANRNTTDTKVCLCDLYSTGEGWS
jgi:hypothetical protein